jgi:hypothetical protein
MGKFPFPGGGGVSTNFFLGRNSEIRKIKRGNVKEKRKKDES